MPGLETASISRSRQVVKAVGNLSTAFPHYFLVNPEYSSQTCAQKPARALYVLDTPDPTGKHTVSPLKNLLIAGLCQSFHVMTEISHSLWRFLAPEKSGHRQLFEEAYRKGAQPQLEMAQRYQSVLVRAPWDLSTTSRINSQKIWKLGYAKITCSNFPSHCHQALPQSHCLLTNSPWQLEFSVCLIAVIFLRLFFFPLDALV